MRSSLPSTWIPLSAAAEPVLQEASAQWVRNVDLPAGHRQVLMMLRRGELASKIMEHLREQGIPTPTKSDWIAAINEGHVIRQNGVLKLTPRGGWAVGEIMLDLARKFDIHVITHRPAGRMTNTGPSIHCSTCGVIAYTGKFSGEAALGAHRVSHLEAVAEAKARGVSFADERAAKIEAILKSVERGAQ